MFGGTKWAYIRSNIFLYDCTLKAVSLAVSISSHENDLKRADYKIIVICSVSSEVVLSWWVLVHPSEWSSTVRFFQIKFYFFVTPTWHVIINNKYNYHYWAPPCARSSSILSYMQYFFSLKFFLSIYRYISRLAILFPHWYIILESLKLMK